jgi:hypothetical protein
VRGRAQTQQPAAGVQKHVAGRGAAGGRGRGEDAQGMAQHLAGHEGEDEMVVVDL